MLSLSLIVMLYRYCSQSISLNYISEKYCFLVMTLVFPMLLYTLKQVVAHCIILRNFSAIALDELD